MVKISVCVPAYNRPDMMRQLIASFLKQEYKQKELVISDDSPNDSIKQLVASINDSCIKYFKNNHNLGYSRNFLKAMERATGDYILMLGDDDALLSPYTLTKYVDVFDKNPEVSYAYSNQAQFSNKLKVEYLAKFFQEDILLTRGENAMKHIWATSIFIPGLAIRNNIKLTNFYPQSNMLFPQLELVGHIINQGSAYGIADYLIAGRSHAEQLGFYAIKGERIKGAERHGTVELFIIFKRLTERYKLNFSDDFLAHDLIRRFLVTMLKERMLLGRLRVRQNYQGFCSVSTLAKNSRKLKLSFIIAMVAPVWLIKITRLVAIKVVRFRNRRTYHKVEKRLRYMAQTNE